MDTASAPSAAHAVHHAVNLLPIVVLLGAAVLAVPLSKRLGFGGVMGYLTAGVVIGPFGFGVFSEPQSILHVAELGVVMFLFVIGLEMRPTRLWEMRGEIFGLGLAQVALCSLILTIVGLGLGFSLVESFVAGTGFVLTSTAIVMQILDERQVRGLPRGRRTIAILLLEDMAIVPLLAIVSFLAPGGAHESWGERIEGAAIGLACILGLLLAGRYLLDPLFRLLGKAGAREVMTAAALFVVLGAALVMQVGGLSMAMGAFLAGVLLSESTFRHQLEADVEPFRGLLLGLFFVGVGMALDLAVVAQNWELVAAAVAAYMAVKMVVIYSIARLFRLGWREAVGRAVLMAQGGEFAFVLYAAATTSRIIDAETNAVLTATIVISMILTPFLIMLYDRLMPKAKPSMDGVEVVESLAADVLLIGLGRVGQIASQPLLEHGCTLSIIETDTQMIREASEFGFKVYYGDGARLDILRAAGAADAKLIIVAIDDKEACSRIVEIAKTEFPLVPLIVRSYDREHTIELIQMGVDKQMRETFESALALGEMALEMLEPDPVVRSRVMEDVRRHDSERLAVQITSGLYAAQDLIRGNMKPAGISNERPEVR